MQTITTAQATHQDTDEARSVSDMRFAGRNKVTTAYARERHLLLGSAPQVAVQAGGTPVCSNATPRLAFAAAGADFLVEKRPLAYGVPLPADDSPEGEDLFTFTDSRPLSQHRAIVRPDTGACLGVVGSGYTPVQNESLIDLFDYLREDAQLENIVVLEHGRKIFATASIDIQGDVTSGDTVRRYLHAFNSHDGSSAFGVFFSDMRLVCANQLRFIAGRGARRAASEGAGLVMRHTKSVEQFAKSLPRLIDLETARFHKDLQELRALTTSTLTTEAAKAILEATFADKLATPIKDKQLGEMRPRHLGDLDTEIATIRSHAYGSTGIGIDTSERTVYNLFQAITQFETHDTGRAKDEISRARTRLESLWGGVAAKRIERAREACLAFA
jgi:phage/plasmid-like protein (TIGR03299 family)